MDQQGADKATEAMDKTGADVSIALMPPAFTSDAVMEAIDAEFPVLLIIRDLLIITEGPFVDSAEFWAHALNTGNTMRIINPTCPASSHLVRRSESPQPASSPRARSGLSPSQAPYDGNAGKRTISPSKPRVLVTHVSSHNENHDTGSATTTALSVSLPPTSFFASRRDPDADIRSPTTWRSCRIRAKTRHRHPTSCCPPHPSPHNARHHFQPARPPVRQQPQHHRALVGRADGAVGFVGGSAGLKGALGVRQRDSVNAGVVRMDT